MEVHFLCKIIVVSACGTVIVWVQNHPTSEVNCCLFPSTAWPGVVVLRRTSPLPRSAWFSHASTDVQFSALVRFSALHLWSLLCCCRVVQRSSSYLRLCASLHLSMCGEWRSRKQPRNELGDTPAAGPSAVVTIALSHAIFILFYEATQ